MGTYSIAYDEKYKCQKCGKIFYDSYEIDHTIWRCPNCNGELHIAAPELEYGHTMMRIPVAELRKSDSIHMPFTNELNDIYKVSETEKGQIYVAIKDYGSRIYNKTDFVDIVMGGYSEGEWIE